jgi:hypothetical protein
MIKTMVDSGHIIYYLEQDDETIIGFVTMSINNQYNMVKPHLVVDYMYIDPKHRGTKATALLFGLIGHVADTMGMDVIGTTFVTSGNIRNASIVGGKEVAVVYSYARDDFNYKYKKYIRRYIK